VKKILVIGFGRMGITHTAHINGYYLGDCDIDVYDPGAVFQFLSYFKVRNNLRFLREIPKEGKYDAVYITSPPKAHFDNLIRSYGLSNAFFIEKPLMIPPEQLRTTDKSIMCGYVLRNNPCVQKLKELLLGKRNLVITVKVESNLGYNLGDDWRFDLSRGGGCINELGSHALNLALIFRESPVSGNDLEVRNINVAEFDVSIVGDVILNVSGDWNKKVRKTVYTIRAGNAEIDLFTDLQSLSGTFLGEEFSWSPRQEELSVGYYMRGIDFALQSDNFLEGNILEKDLNDALITDNLLTDIVKNA